MTSILACTLDAGSPGIVGHLFGDCDLLGWLLDAPAQVTPERRPGDNRCAGPQRTTYRTISVMAFLLWVPSLL